MARTQMDKYGIRDRNITGASLVSEMRIWDETKAYSVDDKVYWAASIYRCTTAVNNNDLEGTITNSPDNDTANWVVDIPSAPPNTYATCTNGTAQTVNNTEVRVALANENDSTEVSIETSLNRATFNTDGRYRITYKINLQDSSSTRINPWAYFKINGTIENASKCYSYNRNTPDGYSTIYFQMTLDMVATDYIEFFMINNSSDNFSIISTESYFEFEYIAIK